MKARFLWVTLILFTLMILPSVESSLNDGVVGFWKMNTNSSIKISSEIDSKNDGYIRGTLYYRNDSYCKIGGCYYNPTTNSNPRIRIYNLSSTNRDNETYSFWYKADTCAGGNNNNYAVDIFNNKIVLAFQTVSQFFVYYPTSKTINFSCSTNWDFFTITTQKSTNAFKIYRNGSLIIDKSDYTAPAYNDTIGFFGPISNDIMSTAGTFDEIGLWNRTMGDIEIGELFNDMISGFSYPFPVVNFNITLLNRTPSDITDSNALGTGANFTYFMNVTNANFSNAYLNWSIVTSTGYWLTINGTIQPSFRQISSYKNASLNFSFHLDDNDIYPGVHNLDDDIMDNSQHYLQSLSATDYLKTRLVGVRNTSNLSVVEIMVNGTGICRLFYCNESYTSGNPSINQNCFEFADQNGVLFNHTSNQSRHNIFSFNLFNNSIGTVRVTNTSYFMVKGVVTGGCTVGYVNVTTRKDQVQLSTNLGGAYSNMTYTPDLHIHQYDQTDYLSIYACIKNNSGTTFCSTELQDNLNITLIKPTNVQIYKPDNNITDTLIVNFSASTPMFNANISYYTVYIHRGDYNLSILSNGTLSTLYSYNITALNYSYGQIFGVAVRSTDTNGQNSLEYSDLFYNVPPPASVNEQLVALLSDINSTLKGVQNTQNKDSGGVNMIGLYIMLTALTIFAFMRNDRAVNIIIGLLDFFIGLKAISLGGADAMIGVMIIIISIILFAIDPDAQNT